MMFARIYRRSENILIDQYFVSVGVAVMTGVRVFFFYLFDMLFHFFLAFYMKNISDESRSLDFRDFEFDVFVDCLVETFVHESF